MTIEELAAELRRRVEEEGLQYGEAILELQAEGIWPDGIDQNEVVRLLQSQDKERKEEAALDADGDGNTEAAERQGSATAGAVGQLQDQDPLNDAEAQDVLESMGADPLLIEYFGGAQPTSRQLQEALDAYNELAPRPADDVNDLVTRWRLAQSSQASDPVALLVFEAIAPERTEDFVYIGRQSAKPGAPSSRVQVRGIHFRALRDNFGGDSVARNQALIYGRQGVPASAMAGALSVAGALGPAALPSNSAETSKRYLQDAVTLNAFTAYEQANGRMFIRNRPEDSSTVDHTFAETVRRQLGDDEEFQALQTEILGNSDFMEAIGRTAEETGNEKRPERTAAQAVLATTRYQTAYARYHNHGLALVALRDPKLAQEIFDNGRVPTDRLADVQQVFLDAGYSAEQWASQGDAFDGHMWDALLGAAAGSASASADGGVGVQRDVRIINTPDDASLEESMRNLWRAWFRAEPSEEELAGFVGGIDALFTAEEQRISAATQGAVQQYNPFQEKAPGNPAPLFVQSRQIDPESELIQRARRSEQYRRMFGKKPDYMAEDEYISRFETTARSFAGQSVSGTDAVGAGMQSGDTNTTVGQLLLDRNTFEDSSTFRDRLFRAAQTIRDIL